MGRKDQAPMRKGGEVGRYRGGSDSMYLVVSKSLNGGRDRPVASDTCLLVPRWVRLEYLRQ